MMKRIRRLSSMAAVVAMIALCAPSEAQQAKATETDATAPGYRIGPEDIIQVSVFGNEALTRTVPVRPDGMITLPLLNDIKAAGLTPMELRDLIMKRLVEFVPSPEVAVIVTEVRSLMVSVIGQVAKPGRYDLKSAGTVVDALAMAGGFKEFAARSKVVVMRTENGIAKRLPFDYDRMAAAKNRQDNFVLRAGDIVMVP